MNARQENGVLGPALETLLKELGCYVNDDGNIASIIFRPRRIKLEKRGDYWYDSEKNLWFYSRRQIVNYISRPTLGSL